MHTFIKEQGLGIPPATKSMTSNYFNKKNRKVEPKEPPSFSVLHFLIIAEYTHQFKISVYS